MTIRHFVLRVVRNSACMFCMSVCFEHTKGIGFHLKEDNETVMN